MTDYDSDYDYTDENDPEVKWIYIWRYDDMRLAKGALLWAGCALVLWMLIQLLNGGGGA